MNSSHSEVQAAARAEAFSMPLDQIDPGTPAYFENDTVGHFFERLRRDDPVDHCVSLLYGPYWSITRFQDIMLALCARVHRTACSHSSLI